MAAVLLHAAALNCRANEPLGESSLTVAVPDNSAQGILRSTKVAGFDTSLRYALRLGLRLGGTGLGGYLGDLYGYLAHASTGGEYRMSVLLNRPGRSIYQPSGYDQTGMDVIFSADASHDFHVYQDHNPVIVDGKVYGEWQPDGRAVSPYEVTENSPRSSGFESPGDIDPNGDWYLFLADLESGGTMQLESWYLDFTVLPVVPEPNNMHYLLFATGLAAALFLYRRRHRTKNPVPHRRHL
jgi:hypothetical protein